MRGLGAAIVEKADVLPGRGIALRGQLQGAILAPPDRNDLLPAGCGDLFEFASLGVVHVDHGDTVIGQDSGKEPCLGGEIGVETLVIVEVVLGEIGEACGG